MISRWLIEVLHTPSASDKISWELDIKYLKELLDSKRMWKAHKESFVEKVRRAIRKYRKLKGKSSERKPRIMH